MFKPLFVLALIPLTTAFDNKMSWCDYWYKRGVARSECTKPRQVHWSLVSNLGQEINKNILSMPICDMVTDWGKCQRSDHCPLGLLCWVHGNPCCTPQTKASGIDTSGTCPSQQAMGIQCNARTTVNWCFTDSDCHRFNQLQKCCPSGCGYNICVRTSPPLDLQSRISALIAVPSQCPRMDTLGISCSRTHGVSWCNRDTDCFSNGAMVRHCCPTTCGYNVCLLRLDESRWIIA